MFIKAPSTNCLLLTEFLLSNLLLSKQKNNIYINILQKTNNTKQNNKKEKFILMIKQFLINFFFLFIYLSISIEKHKILKKRRERERKLIICKKLKEEEKN